jgi:hypothetical protein
MASQSGAVTTWPAESAARASTVSAASITLALGAFIVSIEISLIRLPSTSTLA